MLNRGVTSAQNRKVTNLESVNRQIKKRRNRKSRLCPRIGFTGSSPPTPLQKCAFKIYICIYPQKGQDRWLGPQAPIFGRHVSAGATILGSMCYYIRLRALLYLGCVRYYTCVRHISACASILEFCSILKGGWGGAKILLCDRAPNLSMEGTIYQRTHYCDARKYSSARNPSIVAHAT